MVFDTRKKGIVVKPLKPSKIFEISGEISKARLAYGNACNKAESIFRNKERKAKEGGELVTYELKQARKRYDEINETARQVYLNLTRPMRDALNEAQQKYDRFWALADGAVLVAQEKCNRDKMIAKKKFRKSERKAVRVDG